MSADVSIRDMEEGDAPVISAAFVAQGWDKPVAQYRRYWSEHSAGERRVLIADVGDAFAGYLTIVWVSHYPPFRDAGIPEVVDFNVLNAFQRRRVGSALMDRAEEIVAQTHDLVGIGVGLYKSYGPAQAMYAARGYIPDARGIAYNDRFPEYGDHVSVDDSLTLHLTKRLRR